MTTIKEWLEQLNLAKHADVFAAHAIDFDVLHEISDEDLRTLDIPLGDRKRILNAIKSISDPSNAGFGATANDEGERRQITVMFADLVGSFALSERFDLEEYHSILSAYCKFCIDVVQKHGGFVAQIRGDGVLAYFGYPQASEDDGEQAVTAGLKIAADVPNIQTQHNLNLQARVGIATGVVLVDDSNNRHVSRSAAHGETPNLAARLQELSKPGSVYIDDKTRRFLGLSFDCSALGERKLKGFSEKIQVWEVKGSRPAATRFDAHQKGLLTSYVNRKEEFELLHRRWNNAKTGVGQTVLIAGEPGIGKSRIVKEFYEQVAFEPHNLLSYQCSPNQTGSPLHPLIAQLELKLGFTVNDNAKKKLGKIRHWVERELPFDSNALNIFAKLLSVPTGDEDATEIEPREFKKQIFSLLFDALANYRDLGMLVIVVEDLHWIDPTSQELLDSLVAKTGDWPILLVCTSRPQYTAPWMGNAGVTYLNLQRLNNEQSTTLIRKVVCDVGLPAEMEQAILAKTDGVPFFLEELTKTVLESGYVTRDGSAYKLSPDAGDGLVELPTTLRGSILARLDRIQGAQNVAPAGAAIGRSFSYALLKEVVEIDEDGLQATLKKLIDANLIVQTEAPPDAAYTFKHALVQDVAYETMPRGRRKGTHQRIASLMEVKFAGVFSNKPEILAHHFATAEESGKACRYWQNAAVLARQRSANQEAIRYVRDAMAENEKEGKDDNQITTEIELREMLQILLQILTLGSREIEQNSQALKKLRTKRGDGGELLSVLHTDYSHHIFAGRVSKARDISSKMLDRVQVAKSPAATILGNRCLGFCDFLEAKFDSAMQHFADAISLCEESNNHDIEKYYYANTVLVCNVMTAWSLTLIEDYTKAEKLINVVNDLIEVETDTHSKTYALSILASIHQTAGDSRLALKYATQAIELSRTFNSVYWESWGRIVKGWALAVGGSHHQGIDELNAGLALYEKTGSLQMVPYGLVLLADAYSSAGQLSEATDTINHVTNTAEFREISFVNRLIFAISHRYNADVRT